MQRIVISLLVGLFYCAEGVAQSHFDGFWHSIDDESGEITAVWQLETRDNQLVGHIVDYPNAKAADICDKCTGKLSEFLNKPIKGTTWMQFNQFDDGTWEDGFIIDSGKGKKYDAKVWIDGEFLRLRGYVGFFYRTQTWAKASTGQMP